MTSFLSTLDVLFKTRRSDPTSNDTSIEEGCVSSVNHQNFHLSLMFPSVILTLLMGLTIQRKSLFLNYFDGRPGVAFPMDILGRSNRFSYVAAWGTVAYLVADIVLDGKYAVRLEGKSYVTAFNALLSMVIYGVGYFPLFASLAIDSLFGYLVGTAYAWMLLCLMIYKVSECDLVYQARLILFLRDLPLLLCVGYLSVSLPIRTFRTFRESGFSLKLLTLTEMTSSLRRSKDVLVSPEAVHIRKLLAPPSLPPPEPEELKDKIIASLKKVVATVFYQPLTGFHYSARVLSVMLIGVLLLYKMTLEFIVVYLRIFHLPEEEQLILGSFIAAMVTALILSLVQLLHTLSSYRVNLLALYKGDTTHIPHRDEASKASLLVGTMKYAGFQVGYIAWGFVVHIFILFTIALGLAVVITLLQNGNSEWLVDLIETALPFVFVSLAVHFGQRLLARFVFLQGTGEHIALDNRRVLFVMSFFLFFYNIFIGLFSCLFRIIKSIVIGALFLSRLDNSALPRRFQMMDPGFLAYVGFIHVEAVHSNPIMLVFLRLLMKHRRTDMDEIGDQALCKYRDRLSPHHPSRARVRWHLAYTLFNNPELQTRRKAYLANMKEIQKRLAGKYNLKVSDAATLLENMNAMQLDVSDVDASEGTGTAEGSAAPNTSWERNRSMMKFSKALQKIKRSSKAAGTDESSIELADMAANENNTQGNTTSLWQRFKGLTRKGDNDDFSPV